MGRFLSDLLHEFISCMLPSGQETLVAPQAQGGDLVPEISTPKSLMLLLSVAQGLCPNPFLLLKYNWLSLAYYSHHLGEPLNGLKQLKNRSQWGFNNFFSHDDDKSKPSFYPNKSKPKNDYLLSTLGSKSSSIYQKSINKSTNS